MNKIILCEGETDAILLSYYLEKAGGWSYLSKSPAEINIKASSFEQSVNWYQKGDDKLLICAVGGKDNMSSFFKNKLYRPIIDAVAFSKLAVILDRDNNTIDSLEKHASALFEPVITSLKNNAWISNSYRDSFGEEKQIEALLVAIPTEHQGALETLMLDSISEDPYDAVVVQKSKEFVKDMRETASKYISNNRKELKADLSVTWSIMYPERFLS